MNHFQKEVLFKSTIHKQTYCVDQGCKTYLIKKKNVYKIHKIFRFYSIVIT